MIGAPVRFRLTRKAAALARVPVRRKKLFFAFFFFSSQGAVFWSFLSKIILQTQDLFSSFRIFLLLPSKGAIMAFASVSMITILLAHLPLLASFVPEAFVCRNLIRVQKPSFVGPLTSSTRGYRLVRAAGCTIRAENLQKNFQQTRMEGKEEKQVSFGAMINAASTASEVLHAAMSSLPEVEEIQKLQCRRCIQQHTKRARAHTHTHTSTSMLAMLLRAYWELIYERGKHSCTK